MRVWLLIGSIIGISCIGKAVYALSKRADVIRRVEMSTVVVRVDLKDGIGQGSGTVIGRHAEYAFIVTCHHVIEGSRKIVVHPTWKEKSEVRAFIESDDSDDDLALLVAQLDLPSLPVAATGPELYDTVYLIGAPGGEDGTASEAMITDIDYQMVKKTWYRVTNGFMSPGISGGTATNTDGFMIGVPARASKFTPAQGLLIPLPPLQALVHGYTSVQ